MTGAGTGMDDGRPEPGGVRLFKLIGHRRHENARLLFDTGSRRAEYLAALRHDSVLLGEPQVVFVRPDGVDRPIRAHWRARGHTSGPWRTLTFCASCPHPVYCGTVRTRCELSSDGNPRRAFRTPPAHVEDGSPLGLGALTAAAKSGQIWLNQVDTVVGLVRQLLGTAWNLQLRRWRGEIGRGRAEVLDSLECEWAALIFKGRNPRYAVLPWNTDPARLDRHVMRECYADGEETEDFTAEGGIVAGLMDRLTADARFTVDGLAYEGREQNEAEWAKVAAPFEEQVLWTASILLGLPAGALAASSTACAASAAGSVARPPPRRPVPDADD